MHPHITTHVPGAMLLAALACVSCSDVAPADATAPTAVETIAFSIRPERVEPEFLPSTGRCAGARSERGSPSSPAETRVRRAGASRELQQSLRGGHGPAGPVGERPAVRFDDGVLAACPSADLDADPHPVGGAEQRPLGDPGRLTEVPVALEFGCHVRPQGAIIVAVGTLDDRGRSTTHRLTVDVSE